MKSRKCPAKKKTNRRKNKQTNKEKQLKITKLGRKKVELEWAAVSLLNTKTILRNLLFVHP